MEEIITKNPTPPTVDSMPIQSSPANTVVAPQHSKKKIIWIIVGAVLVLIIAGLVIWHIKKQKELTAEEMLQALKASSNPVTTSVTERGANVTALSAQSSPTITTDEGRLQMLNHLNK